MDCTASEYLQAVQNSKRSPSRPLRFATILRRQNKPDARRPDKHFKEQCCIAVLGDANVGKSSIIRKFLYHQFTQKCHRTIEDLHVADFNLSNGASLRLEIHDTTGASECTAISTSCITDSNVNAFLLVYSVDDWESWTRIDALRADVSERRPNKQHPTSNKFGRGNIIWISFSIHSFRSRLFNAVVMMCQLWLLVINRANVKSIAQFHWVSLQTRRNNGDACILSAVRRKAVMWLTSSQKYCSHWIFTMISLRRCAGCTASIQRINAGKREEKTIKHSFVALFYNICYELNNVSSRVIYFE